MFAQSSRYFGRGMQGERLSPAAVLEHFLQRDRILAMPRQIPLLAVVDEALSKSVVAAASSWQERS
jgi:hypothetical protein